MRGPLDRGWVWRRAAAVLVGLFLAQACGGDSKTGPSGPTQIRVTLTGLETALLPGNCSGKLLITGQGLSLEVPITGDGRAAVSLPPGTYTFTAIITCVKTTGTTTHTGSATAIIGAGQAVNLNIRVQVNQAPIGVVVSCSPGSVLVGQGSSCGCSGSDPDPGTSLSFSWSASGGNLSTTSGPSTTFSSGATGNFDVACAVSDGQATASASTQVSVGSIIPPPVPPGVGTVVLVNASTSTSTVSGITLVGPATLGPFSVSTPPFPSSVTVPSVPAGAYSAVGAAFGATACPPFPLTVTSGGTTTITYALFIFGPGSVCVVS